MRIDWVYAVRFLHQLAVGKALYKGRRTQAFIKRGAL